MQTRLNRLLGGWSAYFSHGTLVPMYQTVDHHVYDRVRSFLCKRHKAQCRGTKRFSREYVYDELGVRFFVACAKCLHRVPCDEASRKAGCGSPACPV